MKILMDADCLIKLTKAGLKELIAGFYTITIPERVKQEVVDAGMMKGCPDAEFIRTNIDNGRIGVAKNPANFAKGDDALLSLFSLSEYDAVGTDDARLARRFKMHGVPYVLPAMLIYILFKENRLNRHNTLDVLTKLSVFISRDEYSTVRMLLER